MNTQLPETATEFSPAMQQALRNGKATLVAHWSVIRDLRKCPEFDGIKMRESVVQHRNAVAAVLDEGHR
jgi:hypothetical protein